VAPRGLTGDERDVRSAPTPRDHGRLAGAGGGASSIYTNDARAVRHICTRKLRPAGMVAIFDACWESEGMARAGEVATWAIPGGLQAALWLAGPGHLDEHNPQDSLIFDAGKHAFTDEPLLRFYAEDIWALDWVRDYLMDEDVAKMTMEVDEFQNMFTREDAEEEEIYNKSDLTQIESDAQWADT
jgi:hypothetical protein